MSFATNEAIANIVERQLSTPEIRIIYGVMTSALYRLTELEHATRLFAGELNSVHEQTVRFLRNQLDTACARLLRESAEGGCDAPTT